MAKCLFRPCLSSNIIIPDCRNYNGERKHHLILGFKITQDKLLWHPKTNSLPFLDLDHPLVWLSRMQTLTTYWHIVTGMVSLLLGSGWVLEDLAPPSLWCCLYAPTSCQTLLYGYSLCRPFACSLNPYQWCCMIQGLKRDKFLVNNTHILRNHAKMILFFLKT